MMKNLIYIVFAVLLVGCSVAECPSGDVTNPDPGPKPKPVSPIKRRPIVPGDKIERPRFTDRVWLPSDGLILCADWTLTSDESLSVTLVNLQTDQKIVRIVTVEDEYFTMPLADDGGEYLLIVEGENTYYDEIINISGK